MFCPVCRDEYRPGFTRCATCDAALVEVLDAGAAPTPAPAPVAVDLPAEEAMESFCGFLTLDEARHARDTVRDAHLPAEILIRDAPATTAGAPVAEEYWLRVRPRDFRAVVGLVGFEPVEAASADDAFGCSACGATVRAADEACPGCGLRFEE
jgi:hypothetical protein